MVQVAEAYCLTRVARGALGDAMRPLGFAFMLERLGRSTMICVRFTRDEGRQHVASSSRALRDARCVRRFR